MRQGTRVMFVDEEGQEFPATVTRQSADGLDLILDKGEKRAGVLPEPKTREAKGVVGWRPFPRAIGDEVEVVDTQGKAKKGKVTSVSGGVVSVRVKGEDVDRTSLVHEHAPHRAATQPFWRDMGAGDFTATAHGIERAPQAEAAGLEEQATERAKSAATAVEGSPPAKTDADRAAGDRNPGEANPNSSTSGRTVGAPGDGTRAPGGESGLRSGGDTGARSQSAKAPSAGEKAAVDRGKGS